MAFSYTTSALVASEIRATTDFDGSTNPTQTTVNNWIEQISERINIVSGRTWGTSQYTEYIDYTGKETITLLHAPVITVDTLQYNKNVLGSSLGTDWETKTEDTDYTVYEKKGTVDILYNNFKPKEGKKRIKIIYTAGYASVPDRIEELATKAVASRVLNSLIHQNVQEGNDGGSISVGQINIVEPASYGVNSYQSLTSEVDALWDEIKGSGVYRYTNG